MDGGRGFATRHASYVGATDFAQHHLSENLFNCGMILMSTLYVLCLCSIVRSILQE